MESSNAIIIALIVIILLAFGVFYFISGNGISFNHEDKLQEPTTNIQSSDKGVQINSNNPTSQVQSSSDSNSGPSTQSSSSDSNSQNPSSSSSDSNSQNPSSSSSDSSSQATSSQDSSDSSSTPQAGQSEGTVDPTDFN